MTGENEMYDNFFSELREVREKISEYNKYKSSPLRETQLMFGSVPMKIKFIPVKGLKSIVEHMKTTSPSSSIIPVLETEIGYKSEYSDLVVYLDKLEELEMSL